jgi:multidrug efflux pump subunit AcrB
MQQVAGARVVPKKLSLGPPIDAPLAVRVYGTGFSEPGFVDESSLRVQAKRVKDLFAAMDGVWDVHDTWGNLGYELEVNIDEERANLAGITNAAVARTLNAYFSGHFLTVFREGDRQIPVYFRLPRQERETLKDARDIFVEGLAGKVPLDSVAAARPARETTKIERRHNNRMIEVRAQVAAGVLANSKLSEALPGIRDIEASLPPGMSLEIAGEHEKTVESAGQMSVALSVAVVLIVLVLIVQYNSFVKPLVILMTVPMGAIGGLFGLWVTGNSLGFMPMLGLVSLAGIVVNSGILYIEFADGLIREKLERRDGMAGPGEKSFNGLKREAFYQCLVQAGKQRMLPIFLTVSTTVGGLLPLAFFGGPMWEGMAFLMIFGLIVATALTLLVLPNIYAAFVEYFGVRLVTVETPPEASGAA